MGGEGFTLGETQVQINQKGGALSRVRRSLKEDDVPRQCLFTGRVINRGSGGPQMFMAGQAGNTQALATTRSDKATLVGHYILKMSENTSSPCASKTFI